MTKCGRFSLLLTLGAGLLAGGCAAVYPEIQTPLRSPAAHQLMDPPPPKDVHWVAFKEGTVPETTRDGRKWHELGNAKPNPYAILFLNGRELIRTDPESATERATWPNAPRGNYRLLPTDKLRVEVWEASLTQRPICVRDLGGANDDWNEDHEITIDCDSGAKVVLAWEDAHGRIGYGFFYELRTLDVFVTRVFEESPAYRAGIRPGDQLVTLGGRRPREMTPGEIQSYLAAPKMEGITVDVAHSDHSTATITVKDGAVYPLFSEIGTLP